MSRDVFTVDPGRTVAEVCASMSERRISCALIREGVRPIGIVTERDVVRKVAAAQRDPTILRAVDIMSSPVLSVAPETTTLEALQHLKSHTFRRLAVVDADGALVGIVTQTDNVPIEKRE